jgi:phosphatidylglycerophosphate synthase
VNPEPNLERWSAWNAATLAAAAIASSALGAPWPAAGAAALSFAALLAAWRGRSTPGGGFGAANAVTAARFVVVLLIGTALHGAPGASVAAAVILVVALDAFDGWLARRNATSSAFGEHFDMETDALLVLIVTLELWTRDRLGAWVLAGGALRYAYVLCLSALPSPCGPQPRSRFGRYVFFVLMTGLVAPLLSSARWATLLAAGGTLAVSASFARGFVYSYARAGLGGSGRSSHGS